MSNQVPGNEVGRLLAGAVPPLPAPEDRVGQVRARARRTRQRMAVAVLAGVAAVAVAVVVSVPQLLAGNTTDVAPAAPADCPTWTEPSYEDSPGPLVPDGAADATLCRRDGDPMLLTSRVGELVDALNALPPLDSGEQVSCEDIGLTPETRGGHTIVLRYPDGSTVAVFMEWTCGVSMAGERTRLGMPLDTFRDLHRSQLAAETDPALIATPECPDRFEPVTLDSFPQDGIERYSVPGTDDPALPSPLVAAVACRYAPDGQGGGGLVDSSADRGDLAGLREALEATFGPADFDHSSCVSAVDNMGDAVPDLIWVADATGGVREFWVYVPAAGAPCPAAFAGRPAAAAEPELTSYLDRVLGPAG